LVPLSDGSDDFVRVLGPAEWVRVVVGLSDVSFDCPLERYERMEHATLEPLFGEFGEEALDGVQPRGRSRCEVSVVHGLGGGAEAQGDVGGRSPNLWMPILPFKLNQDRRHIPRQRRRVTNWPAYDASLRQRGSLTVWFTDEAISAWAAEPRTTRGGQSRYSPVAILTALTLRTVFRLAYRQAEGLLGSIVGLLGLSLRVPDHTTLSRRAATLDVPRPGNAGAADGEPLHLLVDSTGLKLCGKGGAGQGSARGASGIPAEGSGCSRSMGRQHAGRGGPCTSA